MRPEAEQAAFVAEQGLIHEEMCREALREIGMIAQGCLGTDKYTVALNRICEIVGEVL